MNTPSPPPTLCPQCQHYDAIQKVSAIVSAGTSDGFQRVTRHWRDSEGRHHSSTVNEPISMQTKLAATLTAPAIPPPPTWSGWASIVGAVAVALGLLFAAGANSIDFYNKARQNWAWAAEISASPQLARDDPWDRSAYELWSMYSREAEQNMWKSVLSGVACAAGLVILALITRPMVRRMKAHEQRRQSDYKIFLSKAQCRRQAWRRLYYCHLDDIVFFGDSPDTWRPSDRMYTLLTMACPDAETLPAQARPMDQS